jgi:hypothetical protein
MPQIIRTGGDHPVVGTEAGSSQIATDKSIVPGSSDAAGSGSNKGHPASARRVPSAHPNPPAPHVSVHVHH